MDQIRSIPTMFSIVSMYGFDGKHYAYLNFEEPVKIVTRKEVEKRKSVIELQNKLNQET